MTPEQKTKLSWVLAVVFAFALIMGPGPGMSLANKPTSFAGIPALYAWALLWYVVEVAVVILAYLFLWRRPRDAK